jgi:hypothetical protein
MTVVVAFAGIIQNGQETEARVVSIAQAVAVAQVCTECGYVMFTISKAAAKEIGKIKKVNVAKKVAKKPPICLNCGIGGHNKPGFLCESIKNVIGLGDMQKQSNN